MHQIFLSLGSNIEPRENYLLEATKRIQDFTFNVIVSSIYSTEPVDDINQDDFLNIVIYCESELNVYDFFERIQCVEKSIGRVKDINRPKGPRVIDVDIIFYDDLSLKEKTIVLPHSSYEKRNFVLIPLLEVLEVSESKFIEKEKIKYLISNNNDKYVKKYRARNVLNGL